MVPCILEVSDESSCELSFSHVHYVKSFQIVCVGNISDEVGNNHIIFQGRGMNSSDNSSLFSAYHSSHDVLVPVSVFISGDDIALSVSCLSGYKAYFNE
jgi:hypothetical protein